MRYLDRRDAGRRLAAVIEPGLLGDERPLVLGIARGGVPVAAEVASALGGDLDVAVARKIGAPGNPEFAIGAVASDGAVVHNRDAIRALGIPPAYVSEATAGATAEVERRMASYRGERPAPALVGRTVIVTDDGVATGSTLIAVLRSLRAAGASPLVCAVPVGPPDTIGALEREADVVICPMQPVPFRAVGQWYENFAQLDDAEVLAALGGD